MINPLNIDMTTLYDGAKEIVEMYKQELHNQKVDAIGALRNSVDFDFDFDENDITLYFIANSYWYYVEKGRQPDGSGVGPSWTKEEWERDLTNWINKKIARGWWIPKQNQTIPRTAKELKSVSYLIRRKIKDEGWYTDRNSRGLHILENVLDKAESSGLLDQMVNSVVSGFDKEITVEIEKI